MFSDQIHNAPTVVALLDVFHCQVREFRPPQPAAEERSENMARSTTFFVRTSGAFQECLPGGGDSQFPTRGRRAI